MQYRLRIRRPFGLTGAQIGFAIFLGITGGYYIWNPEFKKVQQEKTQESSAEQGQDAPEKPEQRS